MKTSFCSTSLHPNKEKIIDMNIRPFYLQQTISPGYIHMCFARDFKKIVWSLLCLAYCIRKRKENDKDLDMPCVAIRIQTIEKTF